MTITDTATIEAPQAATQAASAAKTIMLAELPPLGQPLDDGTFQGLTTAKDGTHYAVLLLDAKPDARLDWQKAKAWAHGVGGELPTRPVASMLYANAKAQFEPSWYWTRDELQDDTDDEEDASHAWRCYFSYGDVSLSHESFEGRARAVRLIPLSA
ncbi:MAG: DUF1566 domain-containing protein [Burkholderiaceae bacterium]|nr:DUF1566 domain-containing protein [Burkholderiaceae bacterium]